MLFVWEVVIVRRFLFCALVFGSVGAVVLGGSASAQSVAPVAAAQPPGLTLGVAITAALAQHPLVEAARARVTAAQGSRLTATALPNPIGTYWMENTRFPGQSPSNLDREISAYATMPLEPLLQRSSRAAQAGAEVRASEASVVTAERDVALQTARAFYRVAVAQASLDAMNENRAAVQELVDYLRARVSQGASPEGEAIRVEVERDRAETDVTLAEVELLRAQAALRGWVGTDGMTLAAMRVVAPDAALLSGALSPPADFAARALAQRPELATSRAKVQAAASRIDLERSLKIRDLGASFGLKRTAGVNAMVAGISATLPLFDRNRGEIQRATAERIAAEAEVRWLERAISSEVDGAYHAAARLVAQIASLRPAFIRRAEESRQIALGAYQEGAAPLLSVLDASRALTDARLIYARALVAANESIFELGIAAGYDATAAARLGGSR